MRGLKLRSSQILGQDVDKGDSPILENVDTMLEIVPFSNMMNGSFYEDSKAHIIFLQVVFGPTQTLLLTLYTLESTQGSI